MVLVHPIVDSGLGDVSDACVVITRDTRDRIESVSEGWVQDLRLAGRELAVPGRRLMTLG